MFSVARWRLTIVFTLALIVILGVSGFVVYLTTDAALYEQVDNNLEEQALHEEEFMVARAVPAVRTRDAGPESTASTSALRAPKGTSCARGCGRRNH
jgi:hypothetical protein